MSARFNPPPGWQVPAGFRPEPGWSPDPSWPAAPAGWTYWVTDETVVVATVAAPVAGATVPPAAVSTPVPAPYAPSPVPAPPAPEGSADAPVRTRSVARQGAAIPLPAGPLGHLQAPGASATGEPGPGVGARSRSDAASGSGDGRRLSVNPWLVPSVAIACFAFGVIIGIVASLAQASDAGQATVDAQRAQAQVVEDRERLNAQRAEIAADQEALVAREKDVQARETEVSQKEAEQVARETQLAEQEQAAKAQQDPPSNQDWWQGGGSGSNAGFQTCDQLRASGIKTPIKEREPGYDRLLDLDGNGVACE